MVLRSAACRRRTKAGSNRHPQIGNKVIIGSGAQLLGPIRVRNNARVGSNAVVIADVEPGDIVVGVPAHPVGERLRLRGKITAFCGGVFGDRWQTRANTWR